MKDLYERILNLINTKESIVIATIFNSSGSSPRTSGAKMIILKNGSIFGTIGGGKMEAQVQENAKKVFEHKKGTILEFSLKGVKDTDMICGGDVEILLEYIDALDEYTAKIYKEAHNSIKNKQKAFFITEFSEDNKDTIHYLFREDESLDTYKTLDSNILELLKKGIKFKQLKLISSGEKTFIIEPVFNNDTVYIFGAGHVSQRLADLTKMVDFQTVLLDDREEFASRSRFPLADKIIVLDSFDEAFKDININKDSYIVLVTRGHASDLKVLRQALKLNAGYIGMIGSKRKKAELFGTLEKEGFKAEALQQVHCPIGIEIYAETPEEIAVSIAGELIKVRGGNI